MKRTILTILLTLICSSAFVILAGDETDLNIQATQVQAKSNAKKDLAKGLIALTGAGLFGYLSISASNRAYKDHHEYDEYDEFISHISDYIIEPIAKYLPENKVSQYFERECGTIGNALLAFICAKYGAGRLTSVISEKTPENVKQKMSSIHLMITKKTQAYVKQPFSWIINRLKLKNNNKID